MPSQNIELRQIKGLIPALDPRVIGEPHVMEGTNFAMGLQGPYSAFGSSFAQYELIRLGETFETFRVEGEIFGFQEGATLAYNTENDFFYPVHVFTSAGIKWPWSMARVGTDYYFARKGIGVLHYAPETKAWATLSDSNLPANPLSVTQSGGRLVVLGTDKVVWSAQDVGTDLVPALSTGAGFQELSVLVPGNALMVLETAQGWFAYTDEGILRAEFTGQQAPFRIRPLTTEVKPINPYCVIKLSDYGHVLLAKTGLYITQGELPAPWQPLMSEYLKENVLRGQLDLDVDAVLRLHYNQDRQWFFLSIAENEVSFQYTKAWVLYLPRDQWGVFNRTHNGFGELYKTSGANLGFSFGWWCPGVNMHTFDDSTAQETQPDWTETFHWQASVDYPARFCDGKYYMPSVGRGFGYDIRNLVGRATGLYHNDPVEYAATLGTPTDYSAVDGTPAYFKSEGVGAGGMVVRDIQVRAKTYRPLDAHIRVGLLRYTEARYPDEIGRVLDLAIATAEDVGAAEIVDYMDFDSVTEDWNALTGTEDWGSGIQSDIIFDVKVSGSLDGQTVYEGNEITPEQIHDEQGQKFYSLDVFGIYHWIDFHADTIGETFQPKKIEISGTLDGRL